MEDIIFEDRVSSTPNRKILKIVSQSADTIIADIENADTPEKVGTPLNAELLNKFKRTVVDSEKNSKDALLQASEALTTAEAAKRLAEREGTRVTVGGEFVETFNADTKADKTEMPIGLPIGSIICGAIPLNDVSVHLLDGSTISQTGIYEDFSNYLKSIRQTNPDICCTQAEFDNNVSITGNCGKFVIDDLMGTIRLPKITKFIQGLSNISEIGKIEKAGLPNLWGNCKEVIFRDSNFSTDGVFKNSIYNGQYWDSNMGQAYQGNRYTLDFNANAYNPIYGNSNSVQPPAVHYPYYIVLANSIKTDIELDIDKVATDINLINNEINNFRSKHTNWQSVSVLNSASSIGTHTIDMSSVIPNWDADGIYEIILIVEAYTPNTAYMSTYTDLYENSYADQRFSANGRQGGGIYNIPLKRYLHWRITESNLTTLHMYIPLVRRIG